MVETRDILVGVIVLMVGIAIGSIFVPMSQIAKSNSQCPVCPSSGSLAAAMEQPTPTPIMYNGAPELPTVAPEILVPVVTYATPVIEITNGSQIMDPFLNGSVTPQLTPYMETILNQTNSTDRA